MENTQYYFCYNDIGGRAPIGLSVGHKSDNADFDAACEFTGFVQDFIILAASKTAPDVKVLAYPGPRVQAQIVMYGTYVSERDNCTHNYIAVRRIYDQTPALYLSESFRTNSERCSTENRILRAFSTPFTDEMELAWLGASRILNT